MTDVAQAHGEATLIGHVGRKRIRFAITDGMGALRLDTIRSYEAAQTVSISGAIMEFARSAKLGRLPKRSSIAIAGLASGDTMAITKTRWYLSRSGLQGMLGHPPIILNDFAAEAWGLHGADARPQEMFSRHEAFSLQQSGCYLVIGMTSGLGVSVLTRSANGAVHVLPTEAGHSGFVAGSQAIAQLASDMFPGQYPIAAEDILSAPGLVAIYRTLARAAGATPRAQAPEDVTRDVATDEIAARACVLLCQAFWSYAGSLTTSYGSWDGIVVTGGLAAALRPFLRRPEMQAFYAGNGKYKRQLESVPRGYVALEHGELLGAAAALVHQDSFGRLASAQ